MTFEEAQRQYAELYRQYQARQIGPDQFLAAIAALRVQDASGRWYQIDARNGGWLAWDGRAWVPAQQATGMQAAAPAAKGRPGATRARRGEAAAGQVETAMQTAQMLSRSPEQAAGQIAQKGLAGLTSRWWDAASIFGGLAGGFVWLLYSSLRSDREGLDLFTPVIIALLPVILVRFRAPIDRLLLPFQGLRRLFPRVMLVGAGLVAPWVVAQVLYGQTLPIFGLMKEYEYLQTSVLFGTLVSYLILRTPESPQGQPGSR